MTATDLSLELGRQSCSGRVCSCVQFADAAGAGDTRLVLVLTLHRDGCGRMVRSVGNLTLRSSLWSIVTVVDESSSAVSVVGMTDGMLDHLLLHQSKLYLLYHPESSDCGLHLNCKPLA